MEESAKKYLDVQPCKFLPRHENNLANEFRVYANYDTSLNSLEFEEKSWVMWENIIYFVAVTTNPNRKNIS